MTLALAGVPAWAVGDASDDFQGKWGWGAGKPPASPPKLKVVGYRVVAKERVDKAWRMQLAVVVKNYGQPLDDVTLHFYSVSDKTVVEEGEVMLGHLPRGRTRSTDTLTVLHQQGVGWLRKHLRWKLDLGGGDPEENRPPVADAGADQSAEPGALIVLDGSASSDPDGDPLTFAWTLDAPAGSAAALSDPAAVSPSFLADLPGDYLAGLVVDDGEATSAPDSVRIVVATPNRAPSLAPVADQDAVAGRALSVQLAGSDPDGDPLTYALDAAPSGMTVDPGTGLIEWLPAESQLGSAAVTARVADPAGLAATQSFVVRVTAPEPNLPPAITSTPVTAAAVNGAYQYDVDATDPNADDVLTYTLLQAPDGMTIDAATGVIQWTPAATGPADVDLQVSDGAGGIDRQIFLILVSNGADDGAPTLQPIPDQTTIVGRTLMTMAVGSDPEGEALAYRLSNAPAGMMVNTGSGQILWTPTAGQVGSASATVVVTDPGGQSAQTGFAVTVLAEADNQPPVLAAIDDVSVAALSRLDLTFQATDADAGEVLTFALSGAPAGVDFDSGGSLSWLPTSEDLGARTLTVSVTDSAGAADSQSFTVTVVGNPGAPVAVDDAYTLRRTETLSVAAPGVLENDDGRGAPITASRTSDPSLGTVVGFTGDGSFGYVPPPIPPIEIGLDLQCSSPPAFDNSGVAAADVDGDGEVELVGLVTNGNASRLIVIDGATCAIERNVAIAPELGQFGFTSTATLVNLDDDPELEIVMPYFRFSDALPFGAGDRLIALNLDGTPVWSNPGGLSEAVSFSTINNDGDRYKGPTVVDLNGDGRPELIHGWTNVGGGFPSGVTAGAVVAYDGRTGAILWEYVGPPQTSIVNAPKNPLVVDLDLDGTVELIWHTSVLDHNGNLEFLLPTQLTLTRAGVPIGSRHLTTAVANFDNDPYPEIIGYDQTNQYLYEHTGALIWQRARPAPLNNFPLPFTDITVAELDGDPGPEYVFAYQPVGSAGFALMAFDTDGSDLWSHHERDYVVSALLAGELSTPVAFDFDRDGRDELVAVYPGGGSLAAGLYIFAGDTGDVIAHAPLNRSPDGNSAVTVADVDGDGAAEIVTRDNVSLGFDDPVRVFQGLPGNPFPPARPIRNQTVYQPTWVNDDGSIPTYPRPHWLIPGLNKFYASAVIPGDHESTVDAFRYRAGNGFAESNEATVALLLADVNAPSILSTPPLAASPGYEYVYGLLATDADFGDTFTWTVLDGPAGMAIDGFGILTWSPQTADLGTHRVQIAVTDSDGHSDTQTYDLDVVPPVVVPTLVGAPDSGADDNLTGAGLTVGNVTQAFSLTVPAGQVISQSVAGGSTAAAGTVVNYVVSLGPPPIFVPDLEGLTEAVATSTLADVGLTLGSVSYANSAATPRGLVLAQSVAPRTEVAAGTAVDVTVSGGQAVTLDLQRDFLGQNESMSYTVGVFDSAGVAQPLPGDLEVMVEADADTVGTLPVAGDGNILTGADSEGGFTLWVRSDSLGIEQSAAFLVSGAFGSEGSQDTYATFSEQLGRITDRYDALGAALRGGDVVAAAGIGAELAALRGALDLDELALTPAVAPASGFLPDAIPYFPSTADEWFADQVGPTLAALVSSRTFLERLDPAVARNDDIRARFLNQQLEAQLTGFDAELLTRRGTVVFRSELHELLSVELPSLVAADLDVVLGALGDAGLLADARTAAELYARLPDRAPRSLAERPAFFTLGGMVSASSFRMRVVKEFYFPIVKQVVKNLQNLAAEGLLQNFFEPAAIPGIVTGASLSFHSFGLGNSIIEAYSWAEHASGNRVQLIGPTLVADLFDAVSGVRDVRFNNAREVRRSVRAVREAATSAAGVVRDGFAEVYPSSTLAGCVFDSAPDCRQLGFTDGFPTVHTGGSFPGPVLFIVYDAVSGNVSIGNFLFFPTPE